MATPSPVRLLIADRSENRAHEIDSVLRNAGIATRSEFCGDLSDESVTEQAIDLLLCRSGFDHLEQVLPALRKRKPDLPIIVMDDSSEPKNLTRGLALGATDVVFDDDNERFLYVVKRELENVCQRHRFTQTRRALQEAERRCELLLANSTAAIAYVHEGMHIYANDDYFKLFGFEDADELLGVPLLDLLDESFADEFKAKIKTFRDDSSDELAFAFRGRTTGGAPIAGQMTLSGAEYEGEHCTQVLVRSETVPVFQDAVPVLQDALPPIEDAEALPDPAPTLANGTAVDPFQATHAFLAALDADAPLTGAMLVVEVDDFDSLQVELGLLRSESLVSQLTESLAAELGDARLARIANHRFAIAAIGSAAGGDVLAERLRESIEGALFEVEGKTVRRTISIGAAAIGESGSAADAMNLAFKTLVAARAANKTNSIQWPSVTALEAEGNSTDLSGEQKRILKLVNDAIENQTFVLLFQPIISLRGDSDEHYEVFLRLVDEKGRRLPPDQFLDLAIENGVAGKIDRWVILQSIKVLVGTSLEGSQHPLDDQPDAQQPDRRRVHPMARRRDQSRASAERRRDLPDRRTGRFHSRSTGARVRAGFEGDALPHLATPLRRNREPARNAASRSRRLRENRRQARAGAGRRSGQERQTHGDDSRAAATRQTDGHSDGRERDGAFSAVASRRELHSGSLPAGTVDRDELRLRRGRLIVRLGLLDVPVGKSQQKQHAVEPEVRDRVTR